MICNESEMRIEKKERRRKRAFDQALLLEQIDLSEYTFREDAEAVLHTEADKMVVGSGGIFFVVFSAVKTWIIQKLLDNKFGVNK
jgi:hypothetical protein